MDAQPWWPAVSPPSSASSSPAPTPVARRLRSHGPVDPVAHAAAQKRAREAEIARLYNPDRVYEPSAKGIPEHVIGALFEHLCLPEEELRRYQERHGLPAPMMSDVLRIQGLTRFNSPEFACDVWRRFRGNTRVHGINMGELAMYRTSDADALDRDPSRNPWRVFLEVLPTTEIYAVYVSADVDSMISPELKTEIQRAVVENARARGITGGPARWFYEMSTAARELAGGAGSI